MAVIRLTKEFSFEAAHALDGYDGPCREIHGHSYRLFVTVKGCPADDDTNPKCGMVMDFGVLKALSTRRSFPVSTMRSCCGRHAATLPCGRCWPNASATSSRWTTSRRAKTCSAISRHASHAACPWGWNCIRSACMRLQPRSPSGSPRTTADFRPAVPPERHTPTFLPDRPRAQGIGARQTSKGNYY